MFRGNLQTVHADRIYSSEVSILQQVVAVRETEIGVQKHLTCMERSCTCAAWHPRGSRSATSAGGVVTASPEEPKQKWTLVFPRRRRNVMQVDRRPPGIGQGGEEGRLHSGATVWLS